MSDEAFMKEALKEAELALQGGNWPIGCVVVLDGAIIARGHNKVYSSKDRMAHAEMIALQQVKTILHERHGQATLYTTYEPCPLCFGAIVLNRIKRVVFGIDLNQTGAMHFKENLPSFFKREEFNFEVTSGVLAEECSRVFMQGEPTKKLITEGIIKKDYSEI